MEVYAAVQHFVFVEGNNRREAGRVFGLSRELEPGPMQWECIEGPLAGYVQSQDIDHALQVASRIRAGQVSINYPDWDTHAPFGGYKQSGNGREYADWGIHDFVELKGIVGLSK